MDLEGASLLPDGLPSPALSPEVAARIERYEGKWAKQLPREVLQALKRTVAATAPRSESEAVSRLGRACRFAVESGATITRPLVEWFTRPAVAVWVNQARAGTSSWRRVKNYRADLHRVADLLAGLDVTPVQRGPGPNLPALPAKSFELLVAATEDDPAARRALVAAAGAGWACARHEVVLVVDTDGVIEAVTPDGERRQVLDSITPLLCEPGIADPSGWRSLTRIARRSGVDPSNFHLELIRLCRLRALEELPAAVAIVRFRMSERGVEGLIRQLDPVEDWAAWLPLLRDGIEISCEIGFLPRPNARTVRGEDADLGVGLSPTSKISKAEARRLAARFAEKQENPTLPPRLERLVVDYVPSQLSEQVWAAISSSHQLVMRRSTIGGDDAFKKAQTALTAFLAWRHGECLPVDVMTSLTDAAIDQFHRHGLPGAEQRTRNDYASRLRSLARSANPAAAAVPMPVPAGRYVSIRPPLTWLEEAVIRRLTLEQTKPSLRRQLCAAVGLCGGAGVTSGEFVAMRARNVDDRGEDGIVVDVPGKRPRKVMVRREYEPLVRAGIEGLRPGDLLAGRKPDRRNGVAALIERGDYFGQTAEFDGQRLRTTWLAWLLGQRIPLKVILEAAGLESARTLVDLLRYADDDPTDLALLRGPAQ